MKIINLNQLNIKELAELEQLADHSLFECRNCGNEGTPFKCSQSKRLELIENERKIICNQQIKRVESCRNLHIENECLAYSGQYCWNHCNLESSNKVCPKHFKLLKKF